MKKLSSLSRREFIVGTLAAMGTAALAGCGSPTGNAQTASADGPYKLVTAGTLTSIAEMGFMPFEFMDEKTGEPKGFDIDLMKSVAEHMGLASTWLPSQAFDTLVPTIKQGGKADVACSGITINDERKKEVDFSDPYMDSNQSIVLKSGSTETEKTLNDPSKSVACQAGTTGDEWISENLPNAQKVSLADVAAAMAGVQTGLYDAFVIDLPVAANLIKQSYPDLEVAQEIPTGEQYGIAISKNNPELVKAVNEALKAMNEDGSMAEIQRTWFGSEL